VQQIRVRGGVLLSALSELSADICVFDIAKADIYAFCVLNFLLKQYRRSVCGMQEVLK